jgi:hypothetical protein
MAAVEVHDHNEKYSATIGSSAGQWTRPGDLDVLRATPSASRLSSSVPL